jgi:hypothetical protein
MRVPGLIDNLYLLYTGQEQILGKWLGGEGIALRRVSSEGDYVSVAADRWLIDMYVFRTTLDHQAFITSLGYRTFVQGKTPLQGPLQRIPESLPGYRSRAKYCT